MGLERPLRPLPSDSPHTETKTVDIDFIPELPKNSTAALSKFRPQKPITDDPKQQLEVIDKMLREIEEDYMSASAGNGRDSDSVMMSTMKRQPWVSDGFKWAGRLLKPHTLPYLAIFVRLSQDHMG